MSDKYVIYYLQTRACVVEWPGQCHFLLCRWQSLKQSVWTDDRVTGVDRDISTSVPLELFAKTLETGNILQQVTTNYLKWSHAGLMLETVNITQGFCCVSQLWWHGGYVTSELAWFCLVYTRACELLTLVQVVHWLVSVMFLQTCLTGGVLTCLACLFVWLRWSTGLFGHV